MDRKTLKWVAIVLVCFLLVPLLAALIPMLLYVSAIPTPDGVELNKSEATQLVHDFAAYGKICHMDDCTRDYKYLNDIPIRMTANVSKDDTLFGRTNWYYKDVLQEQRIDETAFENFRSRLGSSQLREYIQEGPYHVFVVDGYIGHSWGYLYSPRQPLDKQQRIIAGNHTVWVVERLGSNWYRIAGH